jgi:hypothetical protein
VAQSIVEPGVEHELAATKGSSLGLKPLQQLCSMATASFARIRDQIIHVEKAAVDKSFQDSESGERAWTAIRP